MSKTFDKDMTFSFVLTVEDGKLDTNSAEEEFYKFLRHNEKTVLEESEEWNHDRIISHLNHKEEELLKEEHAKDYHGVDDDMGDAYESWLENLSVKELEEIIDKA